MQAERRRTRSETMGKRYRDPRNNPKILSEMLLVISMLYVLECAVWAIKIACDKMYMKDMVWIYSISDDRG